MIISLAIVFGLMLSLVLASFLLQLGFFNLALIVASFCLLVTLGLIFVYIGDMYRVFIKKQAPYVRTSGPMIEAIIEAVDFKPNSLVCELGCGDGRFLRALSKKRAIKAVGYEYFVVPYCLAKIINLFTRTKAQIYHQSFFKADLSQADYIYCFLMPEPMAKLAKKFKAELKPGTMIISNTFSLPNWQPIKVINLKASQTKGINSRLYLYCQ